MQSPTINNYLETITNPAGRFKSLSGIGILRDENGLPRYAVRSKTLDVAVSFSRKEYVICCPLRHDEVFDLRTYVAAHYPGNDTIPAPRLILNEMLVFNDHDESMWRDILLVETVEPALVARGAPGNRRVEYTPEQQYREGLAAVEEGGKYGYTDREGNRAIPCRYDWADAFDEGLAVVKQGEWFGIIDKKGNEVFPPVYEDIRWRSDNGVVLVCDEGNWTVRSRQGEPVNSNAFDFIFDFSEGLASVRKDGKYGYIDRSGEVAIPLIYDEAYSFSGEGLATVVKNGITFCIDTEGMVFD